MAWFYRLFGLGFTIAWFIIAPVATLSGWEAFAINIIIIVASTAVAEVIDVGKKVDKLTRIVEDLKETSNV